MRASILGAEPLWKYGDRAVSPRRIGAFVLPISAHFPLIMETPRSATSKVLPASGPFVHNTVNTGSQEMSSAGGALSPAAVTPICSANLAEWLPTFGVSWQVLQVPLTVDLPNVSFSPATPVILNGMELKTCSPRARARRAWVTGSLPVRLAQAS